MRNKPGYRFFCVIVGFFTFIVCPMFLGPIWAIFGTLIMLLMSVWDFKRDFFLMHNSKCKI